MSLVLIVDDVAAMAEQYAYDLQRLGGFSTMTAPGGREALVLLEREAVDCVILDLEMPGVDGFEVLRSLEKQGSEVPIIVYTGTGNFDRCVEAIRLGAYTFIDKAESMERVVREVQNAMEQRRLRSEVRTLRRRLDPDSALLGESEPMVRLKALIARVAPIPSPVLIVGESGTGKELVAREIHRLSGRAKEPFLALNSAALPENLVESELFGHERGAFTGADRLRKGAFESAEGGTLFLDEIGELPAAAQAKMLRVLEQEEVTRVGGTRTVAVRCRVLAATHRDLEQDVETERFRGDLFYRLNVHVVVVPPLRERRSDVPVLVEHFLKTTQVRFGGKLRRLGPGVLERLMAHDWSRNNVRELRNTVERMVIAADGETLGPESVPSEIGESGAPVPPSGSDGSRGLKELKAEAERQILVQALDRNDWHITNTARELGLADHASLLKIMRRHGLSRE